MTAPLMLSSISPSVLALALSWPSGGDASLTSVGDPQAIVGGTEAALCEFPSAVAILEDDETPVMCTGTLVHPNVVTLAAHCINPERPVVGIGFGEVGQGEVGQGEGVGPERVVGVEDCVGHPMYSNAGYPDIAYCTLAESVDDVPITPIMAGCEVDALEVGGTVTIVGFGSTWGTYVDGELETQGVGLKRFTTQTIDALELEEDEVHMVGPSGSQSACFGDSGGPAMIEMSDGTWRVFGAASRLYDPGGFPPPEEPDNFCGVGVTYGVLSTRLDWLESQSGYDLTPCHDDSGNWAATADCGAFPTAPQTGTGDWSTGCGGGAVGGGEPLCEDAAGGSSSGGDATDTQGGGGGDTTGDVDEATGGATAGTGGGGETTGELGGTGGGAGTFGSASSGGDDGASVSGPTAGGAEDDSGTGSTGGAAQEESDAGGCACSAEHSPGRGGPGAWLAWGLLGLGAGWRRHHRGARRSRGEAPKRPGA